MKHKIIMAIFAHPDDEIAISGYLMRFISKGNEIHMISATAGEAGRIHNKYFDYDKTQNLEHLRKKEYENACAFLNVNTHNILGYPDNKAAQWDIAQMKNTLLCKFDTIKPTTVITLPPNGGNGHPDHKMISHIVTLACETYSANNDIELLYITSFTKSALQKMLWFLPKSKKMKMISKIGVDDNDVSFRIKLTRKEVHSKLKLALLHRSQFPDEKGRLYKMPKTLFKRVAAYEHYKVHPFNNNK